jgi:hypothetical protein
LKIATQAAMRNFLWADSEDFCHRTNRKIAGILCVFQDFYKQKLGQKIRQQPQTIGLLFAEKWE